MSIASLVPAAFSISPTVAGAITVSGTTGTLTPSAPLAFATTYTATITTAVRDIAGNALESNFSWSFTTGEAPPAVSSTDPASNATGVSVDAVVKATFSRQMNATSITTTTFTVAPAVAGAVSYAGTTATFTPASRLAFATTYTATITTGVTAVNGLALPANHVWTFTTAPQPAAPVASAGSDQDVNRSSNVTLDGSGSHAVSGRPLTYSWTQMLGTDVTGGTGKLSGVRPVFAAPGGVGTLQFDLVVNDTIANSLADRVQINVMKDANNAIFVAGTGQDANAGSRAAPMKTIQAAINKAATPRADLYVGGGQYGETLTLANGVSIFGGFDPANGWVRTQANATIIASPTPLGVSGSSLGNPVELDLLTIRSAAATAPGASSIGVRISNSTSVTVRGCTVQAADGAAGTSGVDGAVGAPGSPGGNGGTGSAGGGGGSPCGPSGGRGGFAVSGQQDGNPGVAGTAVAGGGGFGGGGTAAIGHGQCGIVGTHGNDAPNNATPGVAGANGGNGSQGPFVGTFSANAYLPPNANSGTAGRAGGGGGGGGSGSGDASFCGLNCCNPATSGGGGGGGGGGCGGSQGSGGGGGGGSFAIVSLSSVVSVDGCQLSTGRGGTGGRGGNGASGGGPGGNGAGGATGGQTAGNGAPGKGGGAGGASGAGAGGSGGPSVCVAFVGQLPARPSTTCSKAGGGLGGTGGNAGPLGNSPNGLPGPSDDARSF